VPARVSPTVAVRAEIDELFGSGRDIAEILEDVMRLSALVVLQRVLEEEGTAWLGRSWNSRAGEYQISAMDIGITGDHLRQLYAIAIYGSH